MVILVSILVAAAFAFPVWLAVRIASRRETWAIRVGLVFAIVVAFYPPSIGPMWWAIHQDWCPTWLQSAYPQVYSPIIWLYDVAPYRVRVAMESFAAFWWQ